MRFISISFLLYNNFCPTGKSWKNSLKNPGIPSPQIPQLSASPFHSFRSFSVSVFLLCRNLGRHDIKMGVFSASASQSGVSIDYIPNQFTEPMKISPMVETLSFIQDPMLHLIVLSQRSSFWNSCSCTQEVHPGLESSLSHRGPAVPACPCHADVITASSSAVGVTISPLCLDQFVGQNSDNMLTTCSPEKSPSK